MARSGIVFESEEEMEAWRHYATSVTAMLGVAGIEAAIEVADKLTLAERKRSADLGRISHSDIKKVMELARA